MSIELEKTIFSAGLLPDTPNCEKMETYSCLWNIFCVFYSLYGLFTCGINPRPFPAKSNPEVSHAEVNSLRGRPHHAHSQPSHVCLDFAHDVLLLLGHQHIAQPKLIHNLVCNLLQTAPQTVKLENNCLPPDVN